MVVGASELVEVTRNVWCSVFGEEAELGSVEAELDGASLVTGCVTISGGWEGAVAVGCSSALARRVTAAMFELDPEATSPAEVADAIGEIANMIGGNIKALVPGPSRLSLPAVTDRASGLVVPGSETIASQAFEWGGERLEVRVLQRTERPTRAPLKKEEYE